MIRLDDIVGVSLRKVTYYVLPGLADETVIRHGTRDDVSMGIEFRTEGGGVFMASWVNENLDARVAVDQGDAGERYPHSGDLASVDAGASPAWRALLGRRVTAVESLQGLQPASDELTQVGVRFCFDDAAVTIALGEVDEGDELTYSPNNLVVLFDNDEAARYVASLSPGDTSAESVP